MSENIPDVILFKFSLLNSASLFFRSDYNKIIQYFSTVACIVSVHVYSNSVYYHLFFLLVPMILVSFVYCFIAN